MNTLPISPANADEPIANSLIIPFRGNVGQLHEELVAAFPEWRETIVEGHHAGKFRALESLIEQDGQVTIIFPLTTKPESVEAVLKAHKPDSDYGVDKVAQADTETIRAVLAGTATIDPADLLDVLVRRLVAIDPMLKDATAPAKIYDGGAVAAQPTP